MSALRYWDYFNMTETFTDLHERARNKEIFSTLYDVVISRENILLAYRTIKSNKGSRTAGTDGKTIEDIKVQIRRRNRENHKTKVAELQT